MAELLKILKPQVEVLVTPDSYREGVPADVESYVDEFSRNIDIEPLVFVVAEAMKTYEGKRVESDRWLAPRVHSTLRLYRHEAANMGIWRYLAVVVLRDYVRWRWGKEDGTLDMVRVFGPETRNAIARLWWTAELTRNGPDYAPTAEAFQVQDTALWLIDVDAFHNRAAALGFIEFLKTANDGGRATSKQIQRYGKALNHALTTVILDDLVPDRGPDMDAIQAWISQSPDETVEPVGPDEPKVPEDQIQAVVSFLTHIRDEVDTMSSAA